MSFHQARPAMSHLSLIVWLNWLNWNFVRQTPFHVPCKIWRYWGDLIFFPVHVLVIARTNFQSQDRISKNFFQFFDLRANLMIYCTAEFKISVMDITDWERESWFVPDFTPKQLSAALDFFVPECGMHVIFLRPNFLPACTAGPRTLTHCGHRMLSAGHGHYFRFRVYFWLWTLMHSSSVTFIVCDCQSASLQSWLCSRQNQKVGLQWHPISNISHNH